MALPKTLKNFSVLVDGRGLLGIAEEVTLPKLTVKTEEYRAGDMDAPVQIDLGLEKLECSFTLAEYNAAVLQLFGLVAQRTAKLTLRGAIEGGDGIPQAVVVILFGNIKEVDPGNWKAGDKTQCKFTVAVNYYRLTIAGEEIHEIDADNLVRKIAGVDQLALRRAALGLL